MDQSFGSQLRTTLNTVPAFTWYSLPSGTLTFVNHRYADYLGLESDHPLRFGVETDIPWDTHLQLLHPDDRESSRRVGETILTAGVGQAACGVVQDQDEIIEGHDRMKPAGQVMEEGVQIPMGDNCFRDRQ